MDEWFFKCEEARAYWWMIYCKCRQIQRNYQKKSGRDKEELLHEMAALNSPCEAAMTVMKELLWLYLKQCHGEVQLPPTVTTANWGIKINSIWLWAYFGYHLLQSKFFILYSLSPPAETQFTPNEKLEFYFRLSTFFLQLLNEIRLELDEQEIDEKEKNEQEGIGKSKAIYRLEELEGLTYVQFARSLIYLISEYCHLEVNMPRVFDVESVLQKTIFSDAFLYLTRERYRDHMFHVIDVCLLGFFLLQCRFKNEKSLLSLLSLKNQSMLSLMSRIISGKSSVGSDLVMQNWFLAALFHDVGYSLKAEEQSKKEYQKKSGDQKLTGDEWQKVMEMEKLKIHRRNLAELERRKAQYGANFPLHILNQIEEEKEALHQLETKLEFRYKGITSLSPLTETATNDDETKKDQAEDHGVRSYEYVEEVLNRLPGDNQRWLNQFKPALAAIRSHNLMDQKIDFSEEPLSFLLVLCDELQEWGRARVDMTELREAMVSKIIFPDIDILPTNSLLEYLFMGIELDEEKKCGILTGKQLDFCLFYKDAAKENFEPLAIWLLKSYNFQRQGDLSGTYERDLLRDFMRELRKWRELKDWFEGKEQIKWEIHQSSESEKNLEVEYIIMNLNKFAEKQVLPDNPVSLFDELFQWRQDYISGKRRKL